MNWIEVKVTGRKITLRTDLILSIREEIKFGKKYALIRCVGDTVDIVTEESYEDIVQRVTDFHIMEKLP